jgi:hypothetical protein
MATPYKGTETTAHVGEATRLLTELQGNRGSISGNGKNLTGSPKRPELF